MAVRAKRAHELDNNQLGFYVTDLKRLHRLQPRYFCACAESGAGKGEFRRRELFRRDGTKSPARLQENQRADNNLKKIDATPFFHLFSPSGTVSCKKTCVA